jgi:hypothetical protein
MSKQSYYCPYDNDTKIIRVPNETDCLYTQVVNNYGNEPVNNNNGAAHPHGHSNPSKIFKFSKCKTSEPAVLRHSKLYESGDNVFYKAKDIWEFDNVGVSKPPSNIKNAEIFTLKACEDGEVHNYAVVRYLVCGHCDQGAFGFGGYLMDLDELDKRVEVGFDLSSANPNDLVYFFYL